MYKVYWTEFGQTCGQEVEDIVDALRYAEQKRKAKSRFVTIASENPNQVGQMGVDSVSDGLLPNGEDYVWKKRRM